MKDNQTKKILGFYDEHAEYVKNDRYSDSSQTVYTRPEDKYHWLVAKPQSRQSINTELKKDTSKRKEQSYEAHKI